MDSVARAVVTAGALVLAFVAGRATGSVTGMSLVAATAILASWALVRRRFPLRIRARQWTHPDWVMFLFVAVVFWSVDLRDLGTHRALIGQLLHGNIPPRALNTPRVSSAYHAVYDALVAIVLTVVPLDVQVP